MARTGSVAWQLAVVGRIVAAAAAVVAQRISLAAVVGLEHTVVAERPELAGDTLAAERIAWPIALAVE